MDKPCRMLQLSILKACRGEGGGGGVGVEQGNTTVLRFLKVLLQISQFRATMI